jgi:pyruvate/2-oxoglutarate/acetoin dehydrogenase E1 component
MKLLEEKGEKVDVELIDLRTINPIDEETIVRKS